MFTSDLELHGLHGLVGEGNLYTAEIVGNLDVLDGVELLLGEGFIALLPEMEGHHDVLTSYGLLVHDESTLLALGMQARGEAH